MEEMTMETGRIECVLDSIQLFRGQVHELRQQRHRHFLESIGRMVALVDLPVSIPSFKRQKGPMHYSQTNEGEDCRDVSGKENSLAAAVTEVRSAQLKSSKASGRKSRRRKQPLVDSQAVNQSCQLDTSASTRRGDGGELEEGVVLVQRGNEELVHSMERNKSSSILDRENEELVHSSEGFKSISMSISPTSAGDAKASVQSLQKPSGCSQSNSVSIEGGESSQVKTGVPDLDAPVLTRARARTLQNAGGYVTTARGEPPHKKRRARRANPNSISSSPVKTDETASKVHTIVAQTPVEQQERERPPSKGSVAVKRNTRSNSRSPPQTDGNVGTDEFGEEQEVVGMKLENVPPNTSRTAEEDENVSKMQTIFAQTPLEQQNGERRLSERSVAVKRNTRSNSRSPPQTDGNVGKEVEYVEEQDMNSNSLCRSSKHETAGKMQTIVVQTPVAQGKREIPPSERSVPVKRKTRGNSRSPPQTDGNVGKKDEYGEEQDMNSNSLCRSSEEKHETAGKMQTVVVQTPMAQGKGERPPSERSVPVKRKTRGNSRFSPQTDGNEAKKDGFGEEQDMNPSVICRSSAEKEDTAGKLRTIVVRTPVAQGTGERRPSERSVAVKRKTRGNSRFSPQTDGNEARKGEFGDEDDVNLNSICRSSAEKDDTAGKMQIIVAQTSVEQQNRERSPSLKSVAVKRSTRGDSQSPPQTDGNVGQKDNSGEEGDVNPNAICRSSAEKDKTASNMQTIVAQTPLEQHERERSPSIRPVAVKRSTRGNSQSPPQTDANVGQKDNFGEEDDVNPNSICRSSAEKDETPSNMQTTVAQTPVERPKGERSPSIRSVAVKRSTRSNSRSTPQADGNVAKKDDFGDKQGMNPNSVCRSPAEQDETAGKVQTIVAQTPVEQGKRGRPQSERSVAVKRSTRSNSNSTPQADGNVAKKDAFGEEQEMENLTSNTPRTAEEDDNVGKGRPSKKSRTSLGRSTRLNSSSQAETDAFELARRVEDAKVNEHCLGKVHPSVEEDLNSKVSSVTKRSRKRNGNSRAAFRTLVETDRNVLQFETVMNQNESQGCTAADQHVTKHADRTTEKVVAAYSLLSSSDGVESPQSTNIVMPSVQNDIASELRLLHSSDKIVQVDVADPESVEAVSVDLGDVRNSTDLPSVCMPSAEDPKGKLSTTPSLLKDSADTGSKLISVPSSPLLQKGIVEREAHIIAPDLAEHKNDEDTSSSSDVPAEEQVVEETIPLRVDCHLRKFSNSSREITEENPERTPGIVANSVGEQSSAVELEIKETTMDAVGAGSANLQSSVARKASKRTEERKDGMQLLSVGDSLEVIISPHCRDCVGEFHNSPEAAVDLPQSVDVREGKSRLGQLNVTYNSPQITYRTPLRTAKLLQSIATPEVHREELIDGKTAAVGPDIFQLQTSDRLLGSTAWAEIQGGLISGTISDAAGQADVRAVEQELRKETAGGVENRQPSNLRVLSSVESWDKDRLLEVSKIDPLVAVVSSFDRVIPAASVNEQHRAGEVGVHKYTDLGCDRREEVKLSGGKMSTDHLPEREGCEQTEVSDGKEVAAFVPSSLEKVLESSKALGRFHSEGIAPIDYTPSLTNAQHSSELRLWKLMSRNHVSWTVADAAREDGKHESEIMNPRLVQDAQEDRPGAGSKIKEKGESEWMASKLEDRANKPMLSFPIDGSSLSLQHKKTTDLLLELWKKGSSKQSGLTRAQEGPSRSELPLVSNYKSDGIDEVYRSDVLRKFGANGAVSSLTLPGASLRSGSITGVSAQCSRPRVVLETAVPLSGGTETAREVIVLDSPEDRLQPDQEGNTIKATSSLLVQDPQDAVAALENSGMVECSHETGIVECFLEIDEDCRYVTKRGCTLSEQLLSHEKLNRSKAIPLSGGEADSRTSSLPRRPEGDAAVPVPVSEPCRNPVRPEDSLQQQVLSSNVGNAPKPSSNLIASMKSFVPVVQHQTPSFLPDGKRVVKVKALIAAEAARKAEEEKGDVRDRLRKKNKRGTTEGKEDASRETSMIVPLKESVEASNKLDGDRNRGSILSPRKKVLLRDRSQSRNVFSPEAKSKQATNLEIEKKVKKNQADLKRMEEERKRKLLAARENKEQVVKENRQRQELMKHKKDQKRLGAAELEDKGQRHPAPEDLEGERKAMEEKVKSKQYTAGPREPEHRHGEESKAKGGRKGVMQAQQQKRREAIEDKENDAVEGLSLAVRPNFEGQGQKGRPGQTPGKILSNLLGPGTLALRSAVRIPIVSKDRRTPITLAGAIQQNGRQPSSSCSSSRLLSLNAEPARIPSLNAEHAEGVPHNTTHTFSLDNRPTDVRHGVIGENLLCVATPVEKEEDMGPTSYEMSPYRDSDDEEDESRNYVPKQFPFWTRREKLNPHLLRQLTVDPDEIFSGSKTCSLKEVFKKTGSEKVPDFSKRSGSGDWLKDRVSWKEELQYKIAMRYETQPTQQKYS